jgi:hypothetical protein
MRWNEKSEDWTKWIEGYEAGGMAALVDRSQAPLSHPHAVSPGLIDAIVAARRPRTRWGPRKQLALLGGSRPIARGP